MLYGMFTMRYIFGSIEYTPFAVEDDCKIAANYYNKGNEKYKHQRKVKICLVIESCNDKDSNI